MDPPDAPTTTNRPDTVHVVPDLQRQLVELGTLGALVAIGREGHPYVGQWWVNG